MQTIKIAKIEPNAFLPTRKHPSDAGLDIYANCHVVVNPHSFTIVSTGITLEISEGYVGLLKPKGRNNHLLGAGVVDAGYQGEILVKVANLNEQPLKIKPSDAIAQLLILPIFTPSVLEVPLDQIHSNNSSRGTTGGIVAQHTS